MVLNSFRSLQKLLTAGNIYKAEIDVILTRTAATEIDYTFADETGDPDIWWNNTAAIPERIWLFFVLGPVLPWFFRQKKSGKNARRKKKTKD